MSDNVATEVLRLRLSSELKRRYEKAAEEASMSLSEWARLSLSKVCVVIGPVPSIAEERREAVGGQVAKPVVPEPRKYRYTPENCGWHNFQGGFCIKCGGKE